jgi:hypothetical protein
VRVVEQDEFQHKSPPFLMWYDDNPKIPFADKIAAAMQAYVKRFRGAQPTLVLVNEADAVELAGVTVRGVITVQRNTILVGRLSP